MACKLSITLPSQFKKKLHSQARAQGCSMAGYVRAVLERKIVENEEPVAGLSGKKADSPQSSRPTPSLSPLQVITTLMEGKKGEHFEEAKRLICEVLENFQQKDGFSEKIGSGCDPKLLPNTPFASPLVIPFTIQRKGTFLDVEVEVLDFYHGSPGGYWSGGSYYDDDPPEVQLAREAIVTETGEKIALTPEEHARAEELALVNGLKKGRLASTRRLVKE